MNVLKVSKQNTLNQFSCDVQSPPPISANGVNPLRAVGLDLLKSWTGRKFILPTSPGLFTRFSPGLVGSMIVTTGKLWPFPFRPNYITLFQFICYKSNERDKSFQTKYSESVQLWCAISSPPVWKLRRSTSAPLLTKRIAALSASKIWRKYQMPSNHRVPNADKRAIKM